MLPDRGCTPRAHAPRASGNDGPSRRALRADPGAQIVQTETCLHPREARDAVPTGARPRARRLHGILSLNDIALAAQRQGATTSRHIGETEICDTLGAIGQPHAAKELTPVGVAG